MSPFDFTSYEAFFESYLRAQSNKGHGLLKQWAGALGVSGALLSQIFKGKKKLSPEIAMGLSKILQLNLRETNYLLLLVEHERAGTPLLRDHLAKQIKETQKASRLLKNQIHNVSELSDDAKAHYYASWIYTGIRNLIACHPQLSVDELAKRLKISRTAAIDATEFLLKHELIIFEDQKWKIGPKSTYIASDSPLVRKHHQNWRIKSIQRMDENQEEDFFYTSPMSLSAELAQKLRLEFVALVRKLQAEVGPSDSETVRCLVIDFFEF